jgi:hypothetical protein
MPKIVEINDDCISINFYNELGQSHRTNGPASIMINHSGEESYRYYQNGVLYRPPVNGRTAPINVTKGGGVITCYYSNRVSNMSHCVIRHADYVELNYQDFRITMGGGSLEILNADGLRICYYSLTGNITLLNGLDRWQYDHLNGQTFILDSDGNVTYLTPERANNYILPHGKLAEIPISAFDSFLL